jgi:uncharacterized membrane protein YjdF
MLPEQKHTLLFLLCGFAVVLAWSAVRPHDYFTWALEVFPALLALAALAFTYRRFQFTTLGYVLILLHACILFVGGHYTYAEFPLFNWVRDTFIWRAMTMIAWAILPRALCPRWRRGRCCCGGKLFCDAAGCFSSY